MGWLEHTVIPDINWQRDRHWSRWGSIRVASDDVRFVPKADIQVKSSEAICSKKAALSEPP